MAEVTVEAEEYSLALKALDGLAGGAERLGMQFGALDPESMVKAARLSRRSDYGDPLYRTFLDRLCAAASSQPLTAIGRVSLRQSAMRALRNRQRVEKYFVDHPSVSRTPIERPIFVLGFPRTGTTLLQNLLRLPHDRRALEFWELTAPCPVHSDAELDRARRIRSTDRMLAAAYLIAPEMAAVHEVRSTTAEECWPLFFNTFAVLNYDLQSGLTEYGDWLLECDMRPPYREYRRQLQILMHQRPTSHMVLKCPEHLWFLDSLLEVFPDACVVWTHRDPMDSVASYSSLISMSWRMLYGRFSAARIGSHIQRRFREGVERAMAARDRVGDESRFYDVRFSQLVKDPKGTVRKIHEHFDLRHGSEMDGLVDGFLQQRRADKRGAHKYRAERYGLDPESLYAEFTPYIERFGIELRHR
ncbi:MAG: hypothetical protein ACI8PZ_002872 [Myxococcota bacterium]|jgi:hypothetical protein